MSKLSLALGRKRITKFRSLWRNDQPSVVLMEDMGSLFKPNSINERDEYLLSVSSRSRGRWLWFQTTDINVAGSIQEIEVTAFHDCNMLIFLKFYDRNDAMLHRLSGKAVIVRSVDQILDVLGYKDAAFQGRIQSDTL